MTFSEDISGGDYLVSLEATRDEIARDIEACVSLRDKAALYLRLADVLERIEAARPAESKGDAVDEIAERRAARRSGSSQGVARAKR